MNEATTILVVDDLPQNIRLMEAILSPRGYRVASATSGREALERVASDPIDLVLLDVLMPGIDGYEVCRSLRAEPATRFLPVVMITASGDQQKVAATEAGADDFIAKPFDPAELRARVRVGERIASLQNKLADRVSALENALAQVTQLQGLLPICMYCKKIRNDQNYWQRVESYIGEHSGATFSHGICPECIENRVRPEIERARRERGL
jgi:CheY-like chemotaxis protein